MQDAIKWLRGMLMYGPEEWSMSVERAVEASEEDPCHVLPPGLKGRLIHKMMDAIPFRKVDASTTNPAVFSGCYPNNLVVHTDNQFHENTRHSFCLLNPTSSSRSLSWNLSS
jgi:hypothetical protein